MTVRVVGVDGPRADIAPYDVSRLPGARLVTSEAWETQAARVVAGCVTGPSDRFIDGLEDVLFEKATWLAVRTLDREVESLRKGELVGPPMPHVREIVLAGTSTAQRPMRIHHLLAFHGEERDLLLCSVACEGACEAVSLALEGTAEAPPPPSWLTRAALSSAANPGVSAVLVGALAAAAAGVIVWRRPARP